VLLLSSDEEEVEIVAKPKAKKTKKKVAKN
jgi:hypothetical protein